MVRCSSPDQILRVFSPPATVNRAIVLPVYNEGEYPYDISCEGSDDRRFGHLTGLAFDKFNHVIVCITENSGIFTLGGKYVAKLAGRSFRGSHLAFIRGTQREYSSKPHKPSIFERTLVFKR